MNWQGEYYYFEVKTIGNFKHEDQAILRFSFNDFSSSNFLYLKYILLIDFKNKNIEDQFEEYKGFIENEMQGVISPTTYNKAKYEGEQFSNIEFLIKKIERNYKEGQFYKENTFLVLNVMIPYYFAFNNNDYLPYYLYSSRLISGIFWNTAFCEKGMVVGNYNEDYRIPTLSNNRINKQGILNKYPKIKGLIITQFNKNRDELHNFYLFRYGERLNVITSELVDEYYGWNDSLDSNGFRLRCPNNRKSE
ncbi:hypothetical protein I5729_01485 [Acinetobacter bereziniae]|uniref:hypothetical protein n=1 Tax=Acinetobacter bereziniae TaxID=106648 RepID=UPI00190006F0|nr:hypothetical protein [Acinetobacter bereziniae]MBJ9947788.1 hypothetical protein [Acinetobacter bereziniae]